jgi:hypothetical protein
MHPDHDARRAIVKAPSRDTRCDVGHSVWVPLTEEEQDGWAEMHQHDVEGEVCVRVMNVRGEYIR